MRLLVATDGSHQATAALHAVARVFDPAEDREADLVYVIPDLPIAEPVTPEVKVRTDVVRDSYEVHMLQEAERVLESGCDILEAEGIPTSKLIRKGAAAEVLTRISPDYDAVVVGSRAPGVDNVAARLIGHPGGTVAVLREHAGENPLRVLAAVDGSDAADDAVRDLGRLVELSGAQVDLVHVIETPWIQPGGEMRDELEGRARQIVGAAREQLEMQGAGTRVLLPEGLAHREVLRQVESEDYDLVVLGATGAHDVRHAELGSVSARIVWNTSASLLVAHHP